MFSLSLFCYTVMHTHPLHAEVKSTYFWEHANSFYAYANISKNSQVQLASLTSTLLK